jgi:hypothetical protein
MGRRSKIDPSPIISGHYRTFVDIGNRPTRRDLVEQVGAPAVVGLGAFVGGVSVSQATGVGVLTLAGLFSAFLFALMIQLLDRAAAWAETKPAPGANTSQYATLLSELSANTAYASLVAALTATGGLVAAIATSGWQDRLVASLVVGLLVHLGTTLLMVTRRVFLLTRARLNAARTGSTV